MRSLYLKTLLVLVGVLLAPFCNHGSAQGQNPVELPRKTVKLLNERVVPALQSGNHSAILHFAIPLIRSAKPETLKAVEEYCKQQGAGSLQQQFVDSVVSLVEQGFSPVDAVSDASVASYVCTEFADRVEAAIARGKQHQALQDPLSIPEGFRESEEFLWDIRSLDNEFKTAIRLLEFADTAVRQNLKKLRRLETGPELIERLTTAHENLRLVRDNFDERSAELRLIRIKRAHQQLNKKADFESKLTACMTLSVDAKLLLNFLQDKDPESFNRPALQKKGVAASVNAMLEGGRKAAGEVAMKADLFQEGLHYWLRGRYGEGPLVYGLLKTPEAMRNQATMETLYMPTDWPKPINNYYTDEEHSPGRERRHYYNWGTEYRPLIKKTFATGSGSYPVTFDFEHFV